MIYHEASFTVVAGREKEALERLARVVEYRNKKMSGSRAMLLQAIDGHKNRVRYIDSHESLAAWEEASSALADDAEWNRLNAEGRELTEMDSVEHYFWQVVA